MGVRQLVIRLCVCPAACPPGHVGCPAACLTAIWVSGSLSPAYVGVQQLRPPAVRVSGSVSSPAMWVSGQRVLPMWVSSSLSSSRDGCLGSVSSGYVGVRQLDDALHTPLPPACPAAARNAPPKKGRALEDLVGMRSLGEESEVPLRWPLSITTLSSPTGR